MVKLISQVPRAAFPAFVVVLGPLLLKDHIETVKGGDTYAELRPKVHKHRGDLSIFQWCRLSLSGMGLQRKAKGDVGLESCLHHRGRKHVGLSTFSERSTVCVPADLPHPLCSSLGQAGPHAGLRAINSCVRLFVGKVMNPAVLSIATWKQDNTHCWAGVFILGENNSILYQGIVLSFWNDYVVI